MILPFKMRLESELESLKGFRDALKDLEKRSAFDELVRACMAEQDALANADAPSTLEAILLSVSVNNRMLIYHLARRVDSLEESVCELENLFDAKGR